MIQKEPYFVRPLAWFPVQSVTAQQIGCTLELTCTPFVVTLHAYHFTVPGGRYLLTTESTSVAMQWKQAINTTASKVACLPVLFYQKRYHFPCLAEEHTIENASIYNVCTIE
jgi:hypothetical protein